MTEEKEGVTNGPANNEMAPQEDGTKVPLTNDDVEVKFTSSTNPANGDAKVDMGTAPTFSGLSKEDLMKYADDPFWVRLRWALFILFWAGWAAMLVMAIVIIIQAPRCAPKETLEWVQESAMVQYDNDPMLPEEVIKTAKDLGMKTVYLEELINPLDFNDINPKRYVDVAAVQKVLEAAKKEGLNVVTDFVPTVVSPDNTWRMNPNMSAFFEPDTNNLNFGNPDLIDALADLFRDSWDPIGVKGFLMANPVTELMKNASVTINSKLEDINSDVVHGVVDMATDVLVDPFSPQAYLDFLEEHSNDWSYFKYNPKVAESTTGIDPRTVQLVTLSLFLVPGTPIVDGLEETYLTENSGFINSLSVFREKESVQVGNITFVNNTGSAIAYARVMKGTPGYAVAINLSTDEEIIVDFTSIKGVPTKGDNQLQVFNSTVLGENLGPSKLNAVELMPQEGVVVQFVPSL